MSPEIFECAFDDYFLQYGNDLHVVSIWKIAIKYGIGKLNLELPFDDFIDWQIASNRIQILDIKLEHLKVVVALPLHHRDPFD